MKLSSGNLCIRNAMLEDAKILCKWWNNGEIMAHAGYPNGIGITEEKITKLIEEDNDLNRRLIIEYENVAIGEMNYRTPEEKTAEIGIKICDLSQQSKGFGKKYLKMLIKHIFVNMEYNKIILDTNLKNERAQHVYENLGFRKVRTNIDAWKNQLGKLQSSIDYEMTREEYQHKYSKAE